MKKIVLFAVLAGMTAFAATQKTQQKSQPVITKDTELGPVTAVKREIPDLFKNCTSNIVGDTDQPMYTFSCKIAFKIDAGKELVMSPNPVFWFYEDNCTVEANYNRGNLVMFFGNPRAPSTFDEATECLKLGADSINNKLDLLIFKTP